MTGTPDLNIAGSPIYESLVASTGDPYQPPASQLPDVYAPGPAVAGYAGGAYNGGYDSGGYGAAGYGAGGYGAAGYGSGYDAGAAAPGWGGPGGAAMAGAPAMLTQLLGRMLGDGQSWVAVMVFGGPMADQLRAHQLMQQQFGAFARYGAPAAAGYGSVPGYSFGGGFGNGSGNAPGTGAPDAAMAQAYQQVHQWAAQQQAALAAASQAHGPLAALPPSPDAAETARPAMPPALPPAEATQTYGGMLGQDWAGWLGQTAQSVRPAGDEEEERQEPSYERRGGRLSSRLGAAVRELRGR